MTSGVPETLHESRAAVLMVFRVLPWLCVVLICLSGFRCVSSTPTGKMEKVKVTPRGPHFTSCLSREQETFRCWWSAGSFQNFSEAGGLRVFFHNENVSPRGWSECPQYSSSEQNECYFSHRYTSVWTPYCLQLRSAVQNITYDELCFNVEDIVFPEPPVGLNWTLLNISRSGLNFDILVHWVPPQSADVRTGWMTLEYETRYRERGDLSWHTLRVDSSTQKSIYGLRTNSEYEVQVRCKVVASENFGEFSNTIYVLVPQSSSEESRFALGVLLIIGAVGGWTIIFLTIFFQHKRLAVLFLPPIPSPRIKGIDPELLKKGKIDEVNSILDTHRFYKADIFSKDSLVDFIKLDLDEPNYRTEDMDPKGLPGPGSPDLPRWDDALTQDRCCSSEQLNPERKSFDTEQPLSPSFPYQLTPASSRPAVGQCCNPNSATLALYSQVGEVTSTGGLMLSKKQEGKEVGKLIKTRPLRPNDSTYTSEVCARQVSTACCSGAGQSSAKGSSQLEGGVSSNILSQLQPSSNLPLPPASGYTLL